MIGIKIMHFLHAKGPSRQIILFHETKSTNYLFYYLLLKLIIAPTVSIFLVLKHKNRTGTIAPYKVDCTLNWYTVCLHLRNVLNFRM